ncbi:MAG: GNAT family N-acetyltransferase [Candidatus Micrarchaeota archaeon]|nr:GNAT family N-acetyltransferase [Candidatus Micrarchaeota archaeon]
MPDFDIDRATFEQHRMKGVSQDWEFGELLREWGSEPVRFSLEVGGRRVAVQARRESFGPMPAMYVGIGHELQMPQEIADSIIRTLAGGCSGPTILQVDCVNQLHGGSGVVYQVPQLIISLQGEPNPNKKRRQNIRKAIAAGVAQGFMSDSELEMGHRMSKEFGEKHGIKSMSLAFLKRAHASRLAKIFTVKLGGEIVGFEVVLLDKELLKTYSWLAAWTDKGLEANAPSLLTWEIIKWSKQNGFREFDFGGIGFETEKKRNIAFFKESFGGELRHYRSLKSVGVYGMDIPALYRLIDFSYHRIYMPMHDRRQV